METQHMQLAVKLCRELDARYRGDAVRFLEFTKAAALIMIRNRKS
jgi:hypothetical protein